METGKQGEALASQCFGTNAWSLDRPWHDQGWQGTAQRTIARSFAWLGTNCLLLPSHNAKHLKELYTVAMQPDPRANWMGNFE